MSYRDSVSDHAQRWTSIMDQCVEDLQIFHKSPGFNSLGLGVPDNDAQLWQLGREWMALHTAKNAKSNPQSARKKRDVYVATQLYKNGGHTPLIADFIHALRHSDGQSQGEDEPPESHLIITNFHRENNRGLSDVVKQRIQLPDDQITILDGATLADSLTQLFQKLLELQPQRLFLFHHPADPLPCVVAQEELVTQRYVVHHADATPTFGLHLPDVKVIDLNPYAAALSYTQGIPAKLLIPTSPDPGPREKGFLLKGKLVTATCGTEKKYIHDDSCSYPETVAVILEATGGWHVHIGPLGSILLNQIYSMLDSHGLSHDRFIHVPWTSCLAACLWEHQCDLYFSSYPIDGARTNAEVAASATPHLRRLNTPMPAPAEDAFLYDGSLTWRKWDDLKDTLQKVADEQILAEKSRLIRLSYERLHHPTVFTTRLNSIVNGGEGQPDPQWQNRLAHVSRTLAYYGVVNARKTGCYIHALNARIELLQSQRDRLKEKLLNLETDVNDLKNTASTSAGLLSRIRRWLKLRKKT